MKIKIHPHARQRMRERGASASQVRETVLHGTSTPAKFERTRFRRTFAFNGIWNGRRYTRRQIDAFATRIRDGWLVITIIVRYF